MAAVKYYGFKSRTTICSTEGSFSHGVSRKHHATCLLSHGGTAELSGRYRGIASLVFSHRGSASQRIFAARTRIASIFREKKNVYRYQSPPFSKKAMQWGKKWPVQMNLPFFAVEAYVPGGVQNQAE